MKQLSQKRSADRQKMAQQVTGLVAEFGFTAEICPILSDGHQIYMAVTTERGLCASFDFDGKTTHPDSFMVSWHFKERNETQLSPAYWKSVNTCHYRKATTFANGFPAFLEGLRIDLEHIRDGQAFASEPIETRFTGSRLLPA